MVTRRQFLKLGLAASGALFLPRPGPWLRAAQASALVPQTPLPGKTIPKWVDAMPTFVGLRQSGPEIPVEMLEFQQRVLPAMMYNALPPPFNAGTYVWGYNVNNIGPVYPGVTVEARRGVPQRMVYINNLPVSGSVVQQYITIDQTLHWADPLGTAHDQMCHHNPMMWGPDCALPYQGPPPAVVHLHGGEVPSDFDGGPDQWFTPDGLYRGASYRSLDGAPANGAVYEYINGQEGSTLWFHDHTLGATRSNVYAGMAAFYLLRDDWDTGGPDNGPGLPWGAYEIELAVQDRMFDINGQLFFPDVGINPEHPFWLPEFFGDVIVVNGKSWPFFTVEPRRYRFRLLNGSNARFYELRLMNRTTKTPGPPIWVIGSDGGLLDAPAMFSDARGTAPRLVIAPGERYDLIIDFSQFAGQTLTLINTGKAPFPKGVSADPQTTGQILQFRVGRVTSGVDDSYNPASPGGRSLRPAPVIRLAAGGAATVVPDVTRLLTLNEVMGAGGPLEVLVNNTRWTGKTPMDDPVGTVPDAAGNLLTELPRVGSTEVWEIVNLTADAHPIHLHLVQFQLINRQKFNLSAYNAAYNAAFPGGGMDPMTGQPIPAGVFMPSYGPPLPYDSTPKPGGNPDVTPFLQGPVLLPDGKEKGFKDTVVMYPGQVTRIAVRFAPTDMPLGATAPGENSYPFDPTSGPGYVWHCHIVDHEDNEMMRPYNVQP